MGTGTSGWRSRRHWPRRTDRRSRRLRGPVDPSPGRQAWLTTLLRLRGVSVVVPLDDAVAGQIGVLLERSRSSDVVDGHVELLAVALGGVVFTSDPDDVARLAPGVAIQPV